MRALSMLRIQGRAGFVGLTLLATTFAPNARAQSGLPLDELGKQLLDRAASHGVAPRGSEHDLRARLAPLHERIGVGGFELWWPKETLNARGEWSATRLPKESAKFVKLLARVQTLWAPRLSGEIASGADALEVERWASDWKPGRPAARGGACDARLARLVLGRPLSERSVAFVMCIAPTRAHMAALAGAYIACEPRSRSWVDQPWIRTCSSAHFPGAMRVAALSAATPKASSTSMQDTPFDLGSVLQNFTHHASHSLSGARHPSAPAWWSESLALYDTLQALGADESPCTGCAELDSGASALGAFLTQYWVDERKSPFRGAGSAGYFVAELRKRCTVDGFELIDLQSKSTRVRIAPPFLGDGAVVPPLVGASSSGLKQCYAEFYRAYGAAFVRFLDLDGDASAPSTLQRICRELLLAPPPPRSRRDPPAPNFYELVRDGSGKSIGASRDAALDHEAAFVAWLQR